MSKKLTISKTALDGAYGQIVAISIAVDDEAVVNLYSEDWTSEAGLLKDLHHFIEGVYRPSSEMRPVFVGHNIVNFDLRFILQRSMLLGIKPHTVMPFNGKAWDRQIFDTMTHWAGMRDYVSLDKLCRIFGVATKGTELGGEHIDGSKVWDFVKAGRIADVAKYCGADVERVRQLHQRMTFEHSPTEVEVLTKALAAKRKKRLSKKKVAA